VHLKNLEGAFPFIPIHSIKLNVPHFEFASTPKLKSSLHLEKGISLSILKVDYVLKLRS
jgi:hypothetical protein